MLRAHQAMPGSPDTDRALAFIEDAYGSRLRRRGRSTDHPIAVGELLREDGQPQQLVLAGLLHDVLEDTEVPRDELERQFGPEVTRLVAALSQDESIPKHRTRKAALRKQVLDAGPDAATVALADKAAKLASERERPKERRLDHYRETLSGVEERYGHSALSERLREELARFPDSANGSEPQ
jgi:GTP pyrophosphokinase